MHIGRIWPIVHKGKILIQTVETSFLNVILMVYYGFVQLYCSFTLLGIYRYLSFGGVHLQKIMNLIGRILLHITRSVIVCLFYWSPIGKNIILCSKTLFQFNSITKCSGVDIIIYCMILSIKRKYKRPTAGTY